MDGELIGELARRTIQKFEKTFIDLRYNNHICYVSDMNSFFKSFAAANVTQSFRRLEIWSDIWLHVASESSIITQTIFTSQEKHSSESCILSIFHSEKIKSCLKAWPFLISKIFVLRRRRIKKLKPQNGSESMSLYRS